MIRMREIFVGNPQKLKMEWHRNLLYHYYAVNELRAEYGKPMFCTSGVRTVEQQKIIYKQINRDRAAKGLPLIPTPLNSAHVMGAATDWKDYDGQLYQFVVERPDMMEELNLWVEDKMYTPYHTHIQTIPPKSGARIFRPY